MPRKKFEFDAPKFESIRNRVADIYIHDGESIRAKKTVHTTPIIFQEMHWMIGEIERLAGGVLGDEKDKFRYAKIAKTVNGVLEQHGDKVTFGEIMKVSATIFSAMRFLVQQLQTIVKQEDPDAIAPLTLPPAETNRIELNLEEGIGDTGIEEEQAFAEVQGAIGELQEV